MSLRIPVKPTSSLHNSTIQRKFETLVLDITRIHFSRFISGKSIHRNIQQLIGRICLIPSGINTKTVPETLDPINLLGVLRRARGSFVIVTNEFGVVQGLVTPLDVLEAIAGEFPDADETPEIITDGDGWLVKGGTDLHALQQALDVEHLADDDDIATVAGLVISANGHIPRVGDVIDVGPLHITIIEANDYRVDLVRIVKEQPAHDEDE